MCSFDFTTHENGPDMAIPTLPDIIERRAVERPHDRAYTFLEDGERERDVLTWLDLYTSSTTLAAALAERTAPGSRILLLFPPGLSFLPAFLASVRAGTIAVLSYPPSGAMGDRVVTRLRGIAANARLSLVVAAGSVHAKRTALIALLPELASVPWMNSDDVVRSSREFVNVRSTVGDIALLQYTSGSTSRPRGVMVSQANLLHNLTSSAALAGHREDSVGVTWLPVNHDMGLIEGVLQPLFSGFPVWLMSPAAFLQRPARWLQAISRVRATHSGAPDFAYELCVRRIPERERQAIDLSSWRTAFNGSEPVRGDTLEAFQRAFGECGFRWEAFRPAYGLAESTLLVSSSAGDEEPHVFRADADSLRNGVAEPAWAGRPSVALVSCGRPAEGTTVAIVDPQHLRRCAHGRVGEIWISGGSVAAGYWERETDTDATFHARIERGGEGPFLRTGDLGFLRGGHLFVTGRIKDLLIVRGVKHYPQDVEFTVERADPAIKPHATAAFNVGHEHGSIAVVAELDTRATRATSAARELPAIATAVAQAVSAAHGFIPETIALVEAGTLPRTTSGKLERYRCGEVLNNRPAIRHLWTADATAAPAYRRRAAS